MRVKRRAGGAPTKTVEDFLQAGTSVICPPPPLISQEYALRRSSIRDRNPDRP